MKIKITPDEVDVIGEYVKENSGIALDASKTYLFESRLSPLIEEQGCSSYLELYEKALGNRQLSILFIDALCTNETSFFRDKSPFDLMVHKLIPDIYTRSPGKKLRVLSAACSSGQELYSILIMLEDAQIKPPKFEMHFEGLDISDSIIAKASRGEYTKFELARGMDSSKLHKYFVASGDNWRIKDEIRSLVRFKKANLLKSEQMNFLGKFDIVLCRNVAIYFTPEDRNILFRNIDNLLAEGGSLIIGATENLSSIKHNFTRKDFHGAFYYDKS